MKIGVFVTGQIRNDFDDARYCLDLLENGFPTAEFKYLVWDYEVEQHRRLLNTISLGDLEKIPNFDIHYSPYLDNPTASEHYQYKKKLKNPNERHLHQTKQMLLHDHLMQLHGSKYDVIVRVRWDTWVSPLIDFTSYAKECYNNSCVISINTRSDYWDDLLHIGEDHGTHAPHIKHRKPDGTIDAPICFDMFQDQGLIIHRRDDWNSEFVQTLHKEKKLLAAEFGWWQIMVDGTSHHRWKHYDGGAGLSRSVRKVDREKVRMIF